MACGLALKRQLDLDSPLGPMHPHSPKRQRTSPYAVPKRPSSSTSPPRTTPQTVPENADNITEELIDAVALQAKKLIQNPRTGGVEQNAQAQVSHSGDNFSDFVKSFLTQCGVAPGADEERPMFSMKQVVSICAKLLKQREDQVRSEYDRLLEGRLAEQYETFVRWTQDELHRRYNDGTPSYVS